NGVQLNGLAGVTYRYSPSMVAGIATGYESFNYSSDNLNGQMQGDGWSNAAYLGLRLREGVRFSAAIAHTDVRYKGAAGTAVGSFRGDRILALTGLAADYHPSANWTIEPSAQIYVQWEADSEYTDSLGTIQPRRELVTGRASAGGKLSYQWRLHKSISV